MRDTGPNLMSLIPKDFMTKKMGSACQAPTWCHSLWARDTAWGSHWQRRNSSCSLLVWWNHSSSSHLREMSCQIADTKAEIRVVLSEVLHCTKLFWKADELNFSIFYKLCVARIKLKKLIVPSDQYKLSYLFNHLMIPKFQAWNAS